MGVATFKYSYLNQEGHCVVNAEYSKCLCVNWKLQKCCIYKKVPKAKTKHFIVVLMPVQLGLVSKGTRARLPLLRGVVFHSTLLSFSFGLKCSHNWENPFIINGWYLPPNHAGVLVSKWFLPCAKPKTKCEQGENRLWQHVWIHGQIKLLKCNHYSLCVPVLTNLSTVLFT